MRLKERLFTLIKKIKLKILNCKNKKSLSCEKGFIYKVLLKLPPSDFHFPAILSHFDFYVNS